MKLFVAILLIVSVVSASPSTMTTVAVVGGGAGISAHSVSEWQSGFGDDTNINGGSAASRIITGPGNSQYKSTRTVDASTSNLYDSSSELIGEGGVIYDDTTSMHDKKIAIPELNDPAGNATQSGQTPSEQQMDTHTYGMGDYVVYQEDKVIEDANVTTDYRAEGGSGMFVSESTASVEAGSSKKSDRVDYTMRRSERVTAYGNSTSSLIGSLSTKYRDFSRPLGFGDANMSPISVDSETGDIVSQ